MHVPRPVRTRRRRRSPRRRRRAVTLGGHADHPDSSTASRSSPSTAPRSASWPGSRPATRPTSPSRRRPCRPAPRPRPTTTASPRRSTCSRPAQAGCGSAGEEARGPRGRLVVIPPGHRAPARQRRRRAARPAVLLLAAVLERGHRDHGSLAAQRADRGPLRTVPVGRRSGEPWHGPVPRALGARSERDLAVERGCSSAETACTSRRRRRGAARDLVAVSASTIAPRRRARARRASAASGGGDAVGRRQRRADADGLLDRSSARRASGLKRLRVERRSSHARRRGRRSRRASISAAAAPFVIRRFATPDAVHRSRAIARRACRRTAGRRPASWSCADQRYSTELDVEALARPRSSAASARPGRRRPRLVAARRRRVSSWPRRTGVAAAPTCAGDSVAEEHALGATAREATRRRSRTSARLASRAKNSAAVRASGSGVAITTSAAVTLAAGVGPHPARRRRRRRRSARERSSTCAPLAVRPRRRCASRKRRGWNSRLVAQPHRRRRPAHGRSTSAASSASSRGRAGARRISTRELAPMLVPASSVSVTRGRSAEVAVDLAAATRPAISSAARRALASA